MKRLVTQDLTGERGCIMSDCGAYRLRLWRQWDADLPRLAVCMLNPSDARHNVEDATDTRIYLRAVDLGFGRYDIVNLFPLSARDPAVMRAHPDPIGPLDIANQMILDVAEGASMILCAWGAEKFATARAAAVLKLLRDAGHAKNLVHLGRNKDGSPKHPLYIPASTRPHPFYFAA